MFEPIGADGPGLRHRVEELLAACADIERDDPSAFHDVRGMLEVAVATEADYVRSAITLIERGLTDAREIDRDIARVYYELHIHLAWHLAIWRPGWSVPLEFGRRSPDPPVAVRKRLRLGGKTRVGNGRGDKV